MEQKISLAIIVDSLQKNTYSVLGKTMFSAFEHFGMPYQVFDMAKDNSFGEGLSFYSGIVIAQEGLGNAFSDFILDKLLQAVKKGVGLVNFDYKINQYPPVYRQILGIDNEIEESKVDGIKIINNEHYITKTKDIGERVNFFQLVPFQKIEKIKGNVLLESFDKDPLVFITHYNSGKIVQFLISPCVWLQKYLGHANGLDDIFWKSIVWSAKKPFVMKAMPPFVTFRIDDVSGSNSLFGKDKKSANYHFQYLDKLNEHNYIPNVGLYIDDISLEDGKIIKSKYDHQQAEFSPHAFKDPKNIADQLIYMKHTGEEFTKEELEKNFKRVDEKFAKWGIKPSKVLNAHFGEVGVNALPFLKERGQTYTMMGLKFGKTWASSEGWNWNPNPFGHLGYMYDFMPDHEDFFCVVSSLNLITNPNLSRKDDSTAPNFDFLFSCTSFWNENPYNDVEKAAKRGAEQIKRGLDNLFFGCLFTHEQRIATLSIDEWDEILSRIDRLTSEYNKIFKSYSYIAQYAKDKLNSHIKKVSHDPYSKKIKCTLDGKTDMPLQLYVFVDKGDEVEYKFESVPAFTGSITISFQVKK